MKLADSKLKVGIIVLLVLIVIAIILIYHFANKREYEIEVGRNIRFRQDTRNILISNINKKVVLEGKLGTTLPDGILPYSCKGFKQTENSICYGWKSLASNFSVVNIAYTQTGTTNCYNIEWNAQDPDFTHRDCFSLSGGKWYGLGLMQSQKWPLNKVSIPMTPLLTGSVYTGTFGSVVDRYLISSNGVAIFIDWDVPFYISINDIDLKTKKVDNQLCLFARYDNSPYPTSDVNTPPKLKYTVCTDLNILNVQRVAINSISDPPVSLPEQALFKKPVWSTWAYFKRDITAAKIDKYVNSISNSTQGGGKDISMLIVGDGWEKRGTVAPKYGVLQFDEGRFPDISGFVSSLQRRGIIVSLWAHPYQNVDSDKFQEGINKDFYVHDAGGEVPGLTRWYHGPCESLVDNKIGAATDFTNPNANSWYKQQLQKLSIFNINTFQFHGGDVGSLPFLSTFSTRPSNPNSYTQEFSKMGATFGTKTVITAASGAQNIPIFVMMHNKNASWGLDNGLETIIPAVLTLGISGYHFVLPPPIGGITFDAEFNRDQELYIRWMGLTTFLTTMHFSVPPTKFDLNTQRIAKKMIDLHTNVVAPLVLAAARETLSSSAPILRPLWWIAHDDSMAHVIDDEFLIGNTTLVAPVLKQGMTKRDIYLPAGKWYDNLRSSEVTGGWIRDYNVALDEVPYFSKR